MSSAALRRVARAGCAVFVLAVLALHVIQPRDVVSVTISEYVLGPAGWLFPLGTGALAVASLAVAALLRRGGSTSRAGRGLLVAWAVGLLVVAAAPTDPIDRSGAPVHLSATGTGHAIAGQVAFVCFGVAVALLTRDERRHGAPTGGLLTATALCLLGLGFAVAVSALGLFGLFGLAERLLLPADVGWLLLATAIARR
jgi:Protein of unknown function (DUF998)